MRSPSLLVIALLLAAACTPAAISAPSSPAPAPESTPPSPAVPEPPPRVEAGYVLLWDWAALYSAPREDAERAQATPAHAGPQPRPGSHLWVFRVVEQAGEWLEVETIEGAGGHCVDHEWQLDDLALRLFVRVEDLVPVTTRAHEVRLANGNALTIGAGLPVIPGDPDQVLSEVVLPLELPDDLIGRSYAQPQRRDHGPGTPGQVDASALELSEGFVLPSSPWYRLMATEARDGRVLATLAQGCVEYQIWVDASAYSPDDPDIWGGLTGRWLEPLRYRLPAGAALYWPDGTPAGSTRAPREFAEIADAPRHCFDQSIAFGEPVADDPNLTLCFDVASVEDTSAK